MVGDDFASLIPEACDTFQNYLKYAEEHPNDSSSRRIVVASEGRELAGLSADVRQVVCLRDFARVFHDVEGAGLSEDALRLAALAWQSEPRLAQTLACEEGGEVADWRYRERAAQGGCPPELEETLDGKHWVVRGYDRLPKKGGGQGFELHGGATLEERLVPVVIFSRTGLFVPNAKTDGKRAQIVEKDDFDL